MQLPLELDIYTLLVLLMVSFVAVVIAEGVFMFIHHSRAAHAKGFAVICLLWAIVELVQLFDEGLITVGAVSNFNSAYLLLSSVVTSASLFFALSAVSDTKFRFGKFLVYSIPVLMLFAAYIVLYHFGLAQAKTNYHFPKIWLNDFSWDLIFCIVALLYCVFNTIYVLIKIRSIIHLYEQFAKDEEFSGHYPTKWLSEMIFWTYGLLAFFVFFLSQSSIELTVIYKSFMMVIMPLMGLGYITNAIGGKSGKVRFVDVYNLKWNPFKMRWETSVKEQYLQQKRIKEEEESENAFVADSRLTDEQSAEYRKKLEEWMDKEKPYLSQEFRAADVYKYLDIDRFTCNELFAKEYNCYFRVWILTYRINYAIELMKQDPDKQIKSIAYESGFSSQAVFARSFANVKGMSCTEYRRALADADLTAQK